MLTVWVCVSAGLPSVVTPTSLCSSDNASPTLDVAGAQSTMSFQKPFASNRTTDALNGQEQAGSWFAAFEAEPTPLVKVRHSAFPIDSSIALRP